MAHFFLKKNIYQKDPIIYLKKFASRVSLYVCKTSHWPQVCGAEKTLKKRKCYCYKEANPGSDPHPIRKILLNMKKRYPTNRAKLLKHF